MMPISTFARNAISASLVPLPNILPSKPLKSDFQAIGDCLAHLAKAKSNKSYERQKSSLPVPVMAVRRLL